MLEGCGALYIKEKYFESSFSASILGKCFIGLVVIHLLVIIVVSIFRTRDYE